MGLRVGLIGCGIISTAHLDGWAALGERARVVAVADLDPAKAAEAAAKAGGVAALTDHRALLDDPAIDAVDLCLPHHLHRRVTEEALAAGKHVLCEKPIATTLADADAMIAAADNAGRVLAIAEQCRFDPLVPQARELLDSGVIGQVSVVQSTMAWWQGGHYMATDWRFDPALMGGGALIDGGIHYVDYVIHLLGHPQTVSASTSRLRDCFRAEDTAIITARFPGDILAVLTVASSSRHAGMAPLRVLGTDGLLTANWDRIEVVSERLPDKRAEYTLPARHGFAREIEHFVECIETGQTPLMGGPEARLNLAFVLAAYESAQTGQVVTLPA